MDNAKYERIKNFVNGWGYNAEEVNAYIRQVAPKLEFNAKKAKHDAMNAFFMGVLGKEAKPRTGTPIPEPTTKENTGLHKDIWLMLGTGPDAVTLEDVADYYAEYTARMAAVREAETPSRMNFSRMLHAMGEEDRQQQNCAEILERHNRIKEAGKGFDMSAFLHNLDTNCDSTPRTITAPRNTSSNNDDVNAILRNLI